LRPRTRAFIEPSPDRQRTSLCTRGVEEANSGFDADFKWLGIQNRLFFTQARCVLARNPRVTKFRIVAGKSSTRLVQLSSRSQVGGGSVAPRARRIVDVTPRRFQFAAFSVQSRGALKKEIIGHLRSSSYSIPPPSPCVRTAVWAMRISLPVEEIRTLTAESHHYDSLWLAVGTGVNYKRMRAQ